MKTSTQAIVFSGLCGFAGGWISLWTVLRWRQRRLKSVSHSAPVETLHWNPLEERRGLGDLILKANHIAITVSDVGRSISFYVDVLGLQQIRRPEFDRHGAWLTMGNIELHLIKGIPSLPPVDNLQVNHISFETHNIDQVLCKLRQFNIRYRQNLAITKSKTDVNVGKRQKPGIIQYFITDPDGYYLEICNCDVLTDFCLNWKEDSPDLDYHEGVAVWRAFDVVQAFSHWKQLAQKQSQNDLDVLLRNKPRSTKVNAKKFLNLCQRRSIYGDVMQGFTDQEIREALLRTRNCVPLAVRLLTEQRAGQRFFQPPSFIEDGKLTQPQAFTFAIESH